jgi:type I restriction enzyme S subunit
LHASDYIDDGIPVINPANLQTGEIVPDMQCTVDQQTFQRLKRHRLDEGDIVFGRRGEMGRCARVTDKSDGFLCGTGSIRVRLNNEMAEPHYTSLFLGIPGVRDHLLLESVGSTMDNLNTGIIARIPFVLPPLEEQTDISGYVEREIGHTRRVFAKVNKSIGTLREYRTAIISAAVTGKIDVRKEVA